MLMTPRATTEMLILGFHKDVFMNKGFINVHLLLKYTLFIPFLFCPFFFKHASYQHFSCASSQANVVPPVGKGCSTPRSQWYHMWRRHEAAWPGPAAGHRWGGNRPLESSRYCPELLLPPRLLGGRRHSESPVTAYS